MGNVVFYNYNVVYMGNIGIGINMKAVDISSDASRGAYNDSFMSESSEIAVFLFFMGKRKKIVSKMKRSRVIKGYLRREDPYVTHLNT